MNTRYVLILMMLLVFATTDASATSQTQSARAVNLDEIDAFVRSEMERAGIPGLSLAVVQGRVMPATAVSIK